MWSRLLHYDVATLNGSEGSGDVYRSLITGSTTELAPLNMSDV